MLEKIIIKNYLSIGTEQELKISNRLTTLIGQNAAGKSTILKAINKLNGIPISKKEKNKEMENEETIIKAYTRLSKKEIKDLNKRHKEKDINHILYLPEKEDIIIETIVEEDGNLKNNYFYNSGERFSVDLFLRSKLYDKISKLLKATKNNELLEELKIDVTNITNIMDQIILLPENLRIIIDSTMESLINNLLKEYDEYKEKIIPRYKYVYMNSFKDILVDDIDIDKIETNSTVMSFLEIAKINVIELKKSVEENDVQRIISLSNKSIKVVTEQFKRIFTQFSSEKEFEIQMAVNTSMKKLFFWVKNDITGQSVIPFSEESEGTQWYLSIYLKLHEYLSGDEENKYVLLLDEPNVYLHASAQYDLLENVFKDELKDIQIIYSTHSPYMINGEDLFSLRIVARDDQTYIFNNTTDFLKTFGSTKKIKDVDVLSPVRLAIGIDIGNNIVLKDNCKVIVVEGAQDYYLLNSIIKKIGKKGNKYVIMPCFGATKISFMCSYLIGMGYKPIALFDGDKEGINAINNLKESSESDDSIPCLTYINTKKEKITLEKMFSTNDFNKILKEKNTINYRNVYNDIDRISFDEETIDNFKYLFEEIDNSYKN